MIYDAFSKNFLKRSKNLFVMQQFSAFLYFLVKNNSDFIFRAFLLFTGSTFSTFEPFIYLALLKTVLS